MKFFLKNRKIIKRTFSSNLGELGIPMVGGAGEWAADPQVPKSSLLIEIGECAKVRLSSAAASPKMAFCCCRRFSFFLRLFRRILWTSNSRLSDNLVMPFLRIRMRSLILALTSFSLVMPAMKFWYSLTLWNSLRILSFSRTGSFWFFFLVDWPLGLIVDFLSPGTGYSLK